MRRPLFFLLFLGALVFGFYINNLSRLREVYRSICDLTEEHFYRSDADVTRWLNRCHRRAAEFPVHSGSDELMRDVQDLMDTLQVSHFQVYNPAQDKKLWKGESVDTGIRSRYVEDHLVIYKVYAGSAAEQAGLRPGDDVVGIEGATQVTPWGAQHRSGQFTIRRAGHTMIFKIAARDLVA